MSDGRCPKCGEPTLASHEYCKSCGERLATGPPRLLILYGCGCAPLLVMGGCVLGSLDKDPLSGAPVNISWLLGGVMLALVGVPLTLLVDRLLRPPGSKS
jgi:hypothetical protein